MASFSNAKSAASTIGRTGGEILTSEAFQAALARGLEKVWKREFAVPMQGMRYVREEKITQESGTFNTFRGAGGLVSQNRDADDIPYSIAGDGFNFTVQTYTYRQGIAVEKTLTEVDDVGVVRGRQSDLANMSKRTLEYAIADLFNRGIYVDSNSRAPVLCDDGCFLVDTARPNADASAGTWANRESAASISETSLFTAQLAARQQTDEAGDLYPTYIEKIIIPPAQEKNLSVLLSSDGKVGYATNDDNYFKGKFPYEVYDWLTSSYIYYQLASPKSDANEVMLFWRVKPEYKTWVDGSNPDITRQRVRMAFGFGIGSPRKAWRGGVVS